MAARKRAPECGPWIDAALEGHASTFRHCRGAAAHAIFGEALALARANGRRVINESDVYAAADAVAYQVASTGDV